jgi:hypothetical protein
MINLYVGKILKNKLSDGSIIIVRIMGLNVAGTNMPRVCDNREMLPDAYLIDKNLTWAAPIENLIEDAETIALTDKSMEPISHKDSLIHWKF